MRETFVERRGTQQPSPVVLTLEEEADLYGKHVQDLCTIAYTTWRKDKRTQDIFLEYPAFTDPNIEDRTIKEEIKRYTNEKIEQVAQHHPILSRETKLFIQSNLLEKIIDQYTEKYETTEKEHEQLKRKWYRTLPLLMIGGAIAGAGLVLETDLHLRYFKLIQSPPLIPISVTSIIEGILGAGLVREIYVKGTLQFENKFAELREKELKEQLENIKSAFKNVFEKTT